MSNLDRLLITQPPSLFTAPTTVKWYMETEDSEICLNAKETCLQMREKLLKNLGDDFDKDALEKTTNAKQLVEFVNFTQEKNALEREDPGFRRQVQKRAESFCIFAEKITQVVQVMVPQDPMYTMPFGCLALLFKIVVWNKERREKLDEFLDNIAEVLPVAEAYAELYNTRQIKEVLALMFMTILELLHAQITTFLLLQPFLLNFPKHTSKSGIIDCKILRSFLGKVTIYYSRNNLKKAVDGLFKPTSNRFEIYMTKLKQYTARLNHHQRLASAAQQDETLKSVKDISSSLAILRHEIELVSQEMNTKINQVEKLWTKQLRLAKQEKMLTAYRELSSVAQLLLPESKPWNMEIRCAREENLEISQRAQSQMRSVIEDLCRWSETVHDKPLLWLSVTAGNQGSWVTQMITEYNAYLTRGDVPLICVFAGVYREKKLTARWLVSLLIIRMMEIFPKVFFEMPDRLNTRVLAQAKTPELWEILDEMIRVYRPVLMIIDRIDLCDFSGENSQWPKVLNNMQTMVLGQKGGLRVLFTSAIEPPVLVQQEDLFETIQSSARIKPFKRYER